MIPLKTIEELISKHALLENDLSSSNIDKKGYLKRIVEKPTLNYLVSVGLYLIKSEVIKKIPTRKKFDMDELIKKIKLSKSKIGIFPISESNWIDTGVFKKEIN